MSRTYEDFDVELRRAGETWTAHVRSPHGEARTAFTLPLSPQEVRLLGLTVARGRRATRSVQAREVDEVKGYGDRLFGALFGGPVLETFRHNQERVRQQPNAGLRVRLRLTDAPDLATVPWEYLYDRELNRFLALDDQTPIVRHLDLPLPAAPLAVEPPLRVLVMIASPADTDVLDVEQEWRRLNEALADLIRDGSVRLERLERATLSALRWRLKAEDFHVFHFIGHGGIDAITHRGVLVLEDDGGGSDVVEAETLAGIISAERTLRLAVLNACEGGRATAGDIFAGTAQTLVQQGVPAVVAMQFEISDDAAIALTHDFYKAIAFGDPVDAALTEARRGLRYEKRNELEWGTPVLYMRAGDGRLFDVRGERRPPAPETLPPPVPPEEAAPPSDAVSAAARDDAARTAARIATLLHESQVAGYAERWEQAESLLEQVLEIDAGHDEARARLDAVRREERLAVLYDTAVHHQEAGRHGAAIEAFRRLRETAGGPYRDVDARIDACRDALKAAGRLSPSARFQHRPRRAAMWAAGALVVLIGGYVVIDDMGLFATHEPPFDPGTYTATQDPGTGALPGGGPLATIGSPLFEPPAVRMAPSRDAEAARSGLVPFGSALAGTLREGQEFEFDLRLEPGAYLLAGSCDAFCDALDLTLTEMGLIIAETQTYEPDPVMPVMVVTPAAFRLSVGMAGCTSGSCAYRVQAYRQP